MRTWLVAAVVALLLLIGAGALAVANLDAFVDANRAAVEARVERAVGRPVSFGAVGISWAGGLGVRVADLRVGEDAAFAKDGPDLLRAEAVDVRVNLLAALFGRIEVTRVILRAPRVTVIQTAAGLSTDSLAGGAPGSGSEAGASREIQVSLVDVRDGELTFIDRTAEPPATFEVKALDVRIPSYRVSEPVALEISAAVAGAKSQNLALSGTIGPLGAGSPPVDLSLKLDPLEIGDLLRLSLLPAALAGSGVVSVEADAEGTLDALAFQANVDAGKAALRYGGALDKPAGVGLDLDLRGSRKGDTVAIDAAKLVLDETVVRASGTLTDSDAPRLEFTAASDGVAPRAFGMGESGDRLRALAAEGRFGFPSSGPRGTLALNSPEGVYARAPYRNLRVEVGVADGRFTVERLAADAFRGQLVARGRYDLARSAFEGSVELAGMRVEELLATRSETGAQLISGTLSGNLDVAGAGSGWKQIERALTGAGELRIADGVLEKFNPAGQIFGALAALASFPGAGLARFVSAHPRTFGAEAAPFGELTGQLRIGEGWVQLRDFVLRTEDYELRGEGRVSLAGALDLKTPMILSPAMSQELLAEAPTLRYLREESGRVEIPVAVRGTASAPVAAPDAARIAALAMPGLLTDVVGGALGVPQPADTPSAEPAPPRPEDAVNELLRQGLEGLLGGGRR